MKKEYLSVVRKEMYLQGLETCKTIDKPGWEIDPNLLPLLEKINSNPELATMTSSLCYCHYESDHTSYLQVAVTEKAEKSIRRLAKELVKLARKKGVAIQILYENSFEPSSTPFQPDEPWGIDMIDNVEKYTSIQRVLFFIDATTPLLHFQTWETLARTLAGI